MSKHIHMTELVNTVGRLASLTLELESVVTKDYYKKLHIDLLNHLSVLEEYALNSKSLLISVYDENIQELDSLAEVCELLEMSLESDGLDLEFKEHDDAVKTYTRAKDNSVYQYTTIKTKLK